MLPQGIFLKSNEGNKYITHTRKFDPEGSGWQITKTRSSFSLYEIFLSKGWDMRGEKVSKFLLPQAFME